MEHIFFGTAEFSVSVMQEQRAPEAIQAAMVEPGVARTPGPGRAREPAEKWNWQSPDRKVSSDLGEEGEIALTGAISPSSCSPEKGKDRHLDSSCKNLLIGVYTAQQLKANCFVDEARGGKLCAFLLFTGMKA